MKIYIPFNSHDFNSILTTLSISPYAFYNKRNYSYKRATKCLLNPNENFLIGFNQPIFHNKETDIEDGYPALIEYEIEDNIPLYDTNFNQLKYAIFSETIFLFQNFSFIFRNEDEQKETFSKTIRSLETKYTDYVKNFSKNLENNFEPFNLEILKNFSFPEKNPNLEKENYFRKERVFNKLLGILLGSAIGFKSTSPENWLNLEICFKKIDNLISEDKNNTNFLDKPKHEPLKKFATELVNTYEKNFNNLYEAIRLIIDKPIDYNTKVYNWTLGDIIKNGFFHILENSPDIINQKDFPLIIKLFFLQDVINHNKDKQELKNYFTQLKKIFDSELENEKQKKNLDSSQLIQVNALSDDTIKFNFSFNKSPYPELIFNYFVLKQDLINNVDDFFTNRSNILIEIGKYIKNKYPAFEESAERKYLLKLLNSFNDIRSSFDIHAIDNEILKIMALLTISGRDLKVYTENCEKENLNNKILIYALWGSIYGVSSLPKTSMTNFQFEDYKILMNVYQQTYEFYTQNIKNQSFNENFVNEPSVDTYSTQQYDTTIETKSSVKQKQLFDSHNLKSQKIDTDKNQNKKSKDQNTNDKKSKKTPKSNKK